MEGEKKRSLAPAPKEAPPQGVPMIFDPDSSEWKVMSTLLPVLKDVYEEAEAPRERKLLDDWIVVSECASCLIKFLGRRDLIEECEKLPRRINVLKEACRVSRFDYSALVRYAEGIYADAAELRDKSYNALKDDKEETAEDLRAQTEIQFANLCLIKYERQLKELDVRRAQEQGAQYVVTLERTKRQVDTLKHRIGQQEQMRQTLQSEVDGLRRKEAEAEKQLNESEGKVSDIPLHAYQEQSRLVLERAKVVSLLEPGPTPLSKIEEDLSIFNIS